MSNDNKAIFVTVGTTLFEALIQVVTTEPALEWMTSNGYTRLIIQYGKGRRPSLPTTNTAIDCEFYDYRPNLTADMVKADLVLSHAGAGTVQELLQLGKKAAVVINTILMDNHQTELAHVMGEKQHLFVVNDPSELRIDTTDSDNAYRIWDAIEAFVPVPYPEGDQYEFVNILNDFMGVPTSHDKKES